MYLYMVCKCKLRKGNNFQCSYVSTNVLYCYTVRYNTAMPVHNMQNSYLCHQRTQNRCKLNCGTDALSMHYWRTLHVKATNGRMDEGEREGGEGGEEGRGQW